MEDFKSFMTRVEPGTVSDEAQVARIQSFLMACWDEFDGSDQESMEAHKLARMEQVRWAPPILGFVIERHGGTVMGSTRAELQFWAVDLERSEARAGSGGYRQLHPRQRPMTRRKMTELVSEIVDLVEKQRKDDRVQYHEDGSVRVLVSNVIADEGPKETVRGRRKRFRKILEELFAEHGYKLVGRYRFRLASDVDNDRTNAEGQRRST